jgi:CRP-like cAMP-binding protein
MAAHGVMSLTCALLCVFRRDALWELHRQSPTMGFNVTWLSAREESLVDEGLLSVGRRSAEGRVSALLILLFKRAARRQLDGGIGGVPFPLTQTQSGRTRLEKPVIQHAMCKSLSGKAAARSHHGSS